MLKSNDYMKKILTIILSIVCIYILFVGEECIRLNNNVNSKPVIILKEEDNFDKNEYTYYSLGFKLKKEYLVDEKSHDDLRFLNIVGEEFYLFDKILLWAWIE